MRKLMTIGIISALCAISGSAFATWTSVAKVTRVRTYSGADKIEVWFDRAVTTGCTYNDRVVLDTSYASSALIERNQALAVSARLSQRDVEVDTLAGCIGGYGKLNYLSIM